MNASNIDAALRIAAIAHKDQVRKEGGVPYIVHPVMVALMLATRGFPDEVVAAALVHDVLEDTDFPEDELRKELGDEVYAIVRSVTHDDTLSWEDKKRAYIESIRAGSDGAKAVSTADKIHNMQSLLKAYSAQGPRLWDAFKASKEQKLWFEEAMLAMLKECWNDPMVGEYEALVAQMRELV